MNSSKYLLFALLIMVSGASLTLTDNLFFHSNQIYVIFLGGAIPLILYWNRLRRVQSIGRNGDGIDYHLTDIEVDSIYYLGFLITLSTLVISVVTAHLGDKIEAFTVVGQFSLGLVATGFALWARLDLQQRNEEHSDPDRLVDEYIAKMGKAVHELDSSYSTLQTVFNTATKGFEDSMSSYVNSADAIQKINTKVARASDALVKKVEDSSLHLVDTSSSLIKINFDLAVASESLNLGLDQANIKSVVINDAFDSLQSMADKFKTMEVVINNFSSALQDLNKVDIGEVVASIESSAEVIGATTKKLEQEINNSIPKLSASIESSAEVIGATTKKLEQEINNSISKLSSNDSQVTLVESFKVIELAISNFSSALQDLNKVDIGEVVASIESSAEIIGSSAKRFEQEMANSTNKMLSNSKSFADDIDESTNQLSGTLASFSGAIVDVATKVTDQLKDR